MNPCTDLPIIISDVRIKLARISECLKKIGVRICQTQHRNILINYSYFRNKFLFVANRKINVRRDA